MSVPDRSSDFCSSSVKPDGIPISERDASPVEIFSVSVSSKSSDGGSHIATAYPSVKPITAIIKSFMRQELVEENLV